MRPTNRFKLGGRLLAAGAGLVLVLKVVWLFVPSILVSSIPTKIIQFLFGLWLALLVAPPSIDERVLGFDWRVLAYIPWGAVVIALLLWIGVKVIRGQPGRGLVPFLWVIGPWMGIGVLAPKLSAGFSYLKAPLDKLLLNLFGDMADIAMLVGIGLILFNYRQAISGADDRSVEGKMTWQRVLFSFEGRISRAQFWLYQVLILSLVSWTPIAVGAWIGDGREEGVVGGYIVGLLLTLWPSIAVGVKRCHDRNRSGAFVLLALVPIVNFWYAIEVLFLKGTDGENQYGPDPLKL